MKIVCDDKLSVYVDGELRIQENRDRWNAVHTLSILKSTKVIGIACVNSRGQYGILGSVADESDKDVLLTGSYWGCSNKLEDGWERADFVEGVNWLAAVELIESDYYNKKGPWRAISTQSKVIWTNRDDRTVYCRKTVDCKFKN